VYNSNRIGALKKEETLVKRNIEIFFILSEGPLAGVIYSCIIFVLKFSIKFLLFPDKYFNFVKKY
jgi:hypothetical protein